MITDSRYIISNVNIFDGTGSPVQKNMWIHVRDGIISKIGNMNETDFAEDVPVYDYRGKFLMPGMIDAHVHMAGGRGEGIWGDTEILCEPDRVRSMRSVYEAQKLLKYGFTTVRDISVNSLYMKRVFNDSTFPGPKVVACGRGLARRGGHCDSPQMDLDYVKKHHFWAIIADGEDECRKAVREQLREGADQIKFWATGGGNWGTDRITDRHYTFREMQVICEEAHMIEGTMVCAHCETRETVRMAIEAGVDTIEHGEGTDAELAEVMAEKGIVFVPTLYLIANWYDFMDMWYPEGVPKLCRPDPFLQRDVGKAVSDKEKADYKDIVLKGFNEARRHGVPIALGSDSVYEPSVAYGEMSLLEYRELVKRGMSVLEALMAATVNGAKACGLEHRVGTLEAGKEADMLVYEEDPTLNAGVVGTHENLKEVILDGRTVCENGLLMW